MPTNLLDGIVPNVPPTLVARAKHSVYVAVTMFAGNVLSNWDDRTLTGFEHTLKAHWNGAGGNALWAVLVANGVLMVAKPRGAVTTPVVVPPGADPPVAPTTPPSGE